MDYIYDIKASVFTGWFKRRKLGDISLSGVHFHNPVSKGEWVNIIFPQYSYGDGNIIKESSAYVGRVSNVVHLGRSGESNGSISTVYAEYRVRSEFSAELHLKKLATLVGIISEEAKHLGMATATSA